MSPTLSPTMVTSGTMVLSLRWKFINLFVFALSDLVGTLDLGEPWPHRSCNGVQGESLIFSHQIISSRWSRHNLLTGRQWPGWHMRDWPESSQAVREKLTSLMSWSITQRRCVGGQGLGDLSYGWRWGDRLEGYRSDSIIDHRWDQGHEVSIFVVIDVEW